MCHSIAPTSIPFSAASEFTFNTRSWIHKDTSHCRQEYCRKSLQYKMVCRLTSANIQSYTARMSVRIILLGYSFSAFRQYVAIDSLIG